MSDLVVVGGILPGSERNGEKNLGNARSRSARDAAMMPTGYTGSATRIMVPSINMR